MHAAARRARMRLHITSDETYHPRELRDGGIVDRRLLIAVQSVVPWLCAVARHFDLDASPARASTTNGVRRHAPA